MNPKTDFFFDKAGKWQEAVEMLRAIVLDCGLDEELKWGVPCYALEKKNIVLIHTFKDYCALLFFKGALMKDTHGILVQQTGNVQAARQIRFTNSPEVVKAGAIIREYIREAIGIERSGAKVPMKKTAQFTVPEEFQRHLEDNAALKEAFEALTPGRQRAYILYFSQAKQAGTREARVEKYLPKILAGKGIND
jgi:uncharacterized protein YdeI (YjbR/CyaY-like superfamily)